MPMRNNGDTPEHRFLAYVSEPITRCPKREKGRIRTLIKNMRKALREPPFLTKLYVPSEVSSPEVRGEMTSEHVYLLDRIRVVEADYVLVIADHTSFGIGGEVEMATSLGKPVIIFSRDDTLSRFLVGTPSNSSRAFGLGEYLHYREWRDLKLELLPLVEKVIQEMENGRHGGIPFFDVGKQLVKLRQLRHLTIEELAARTGLRPPQLRLLEKPIEIIRKELAAYESSDINLGAIDFTPHQLEELANIGLPALHKLAVALEVPVSALLGDSENSVKDPAHLAATQRLRIAEIRDDHLQKRASQYDITFREYQQLKATLVDDFVREMILRPKQSTRHLQVISEGEFKDALANVRNL